MTAVEWLELNLLGLISFDSEELRAKYKDRVSKAKEMEKQQGYSEEDMLKSFMAGIKCESNKGQNFEQFIKQFKNKLWRQIENKPS
jgi:hypothetical protein